ncbi:hypothetical protein [Halofilum ochraceum]|uniref:hypothetical protein n=1 Tax=Halofilum ochraceum TaxID=1611323 RepID=UPI00111303B4|nr:hypothetical protein [Halofilum ochraceum]
MSTRRQEWVDSLRDHLAEWMSRANRLQVEEDKDSIADDPDSKVDIQRLALLRHKIDLMLSAHDKEHMEISKALEDATNAAIAGDADNYFSALTFIRDKARSITKYAWEQAKDDIG